MKFILEIRLGNDAMLDPDNIAEALDDVAGSIRPLADPIDANGIILDYNGNEVGEYSTEED